MPRSDRSYGLHQLDRWVGDVRVTLTSHPPGLCTPVHSHPYACLHFVLEGVYLEQSDEDIVACGPQEIVMKTADVTHGNRMGPQPSRTLRIEWHSPENAPEAPSTNRGLRHDQGPTAALVPRLLELARVITLDGSEDHIRSELNHIEAHWTERMESPPIECLAAEWILAHPNTNRSVADICRHLGVHRSHLARQFKRRFSCTPSEFLRRQRCLWVARALLSTQRRLVDLALEAGFNDQSHCTRAFGSVFGASPGRWRPAID